MIKRLILVVLSAFFLLPTEIRAEEKAFIPDQDKQRDAERTIKDVFKSDYAKRLPGERQALAQKLLQQSIDTKFDPVSKYVLLKESITVAAQAGDIDLAMLSADELDKNYAVDSIAIKMDALAKATGVATTVAANKALIAQYASLRDSALALDNYDLASRLGAFAENSARKCQDPALVSQTQIRNKEVRESQEEFDKVKRAMQVLKDKPDNPESNLAAGRYLCLTKGDWEKGLPLLIKSSDATLKSIASRELAAPSDPTEQVAIADGLWDLAQRESTTGKKQLTRHASVWYEKALPLLTGFEKTKADSRITRQIDTENLPGLKMVSNRKVIANTICIVADDFVVEVYLNGKPVPPESRKFVTESFGATTEKVEVDVHDGDWLVFNVVNNRLRWGGAYYFATAGVLDNGSIAFSSNYQDPLWSACDNISEVSQFIADPAYGADKHTEKVTKPWGEGDRQIKSLAPEWKGTPIWGKSRNTWIKYNCRAKIGPQ